MQFLQINSKFLDKFFFQFALFILFFFSYIHYGNPPANSLDLSWMQALGVAYTQKLQHGTDLIFTYGPLGYFYNASTPYVPDLFYLFITWQFLAAIIIALLFMLRGYNLTNGLDKLVFFALALTLLSVLSMHLFDIAYYLSMLLAVTIIANPPHFLKRLFYVSFIGLALFIFAILSITKFTQLVIAAVNVFAIMGIIGLRYGWLRAALIPVGYASLVALLWVKLGGQQLDNFPLFLSNSLEIVRGYGDAMSSGGSQRNAFLAIGMLGLVALIGGMSTFFPKFNLERLLLTLSIGFGTFVVFKTGFVRHDPGHELIFFGFTMLIPFLFTYDVNMSLLLKSIFHALRYTLVTVAVIGVLWSSQSIGLMNHKTVLALWNQNFVENLQKSLHLSWWKNHYHEHFVLQQKRVDLPKIREIVGDATVDIFSYEQSVLFANQFNWQPRPIFQSYVAYTPKLSDYNRQFYESSQAPEFVIFKLQTMDNRFPMMDDSETIKVLLRNYEFVLEERGYLLLKRMLQKKEVTENRLLERHIKVGKSLKIAAFNEKQLLLKVDISKTWIGWLYSFLYKPSAVYLELTTTENTKLVYRIVPNMLQSGVLINPLITNQEEFISWYQGTFPARKIVSIKILANQGGLKQFQDEVTLTVNSYSVLEQLQDKPNL